MKKIYFATGNSGKVQEMQKLFKDTGYRLEQIEVDIHEIDANNVEDVARRKLEDSLEASGKKPLIVEDTGFYVKALNGFPGASAGFFARTVGAEKLTDLMEDVDDRSAYFKTVLAYFDGDKIKIFSGRSEGKVTQESRGSGHEELHYNSLFVPEGETETYAENPQLIKKYSHRVEAVKKFLEYL